jgi:hypothetical protein
MIITNKPYEIISLPSIEIVCGFQTVTMVEPNKITITT